MKFIKIVVHIAVLYSFFLIGNVIQEFFHLFIPGSVIGMILLFVMLITNRLNVQWLEEGMQFMIQHLPLFFIPATVGIMSYFNLFAGKGILLILIVLLSTILVMSGSGLVSQYLARGKEMEHE